jgi:hypothetical protein
MFESNFGRISHFSASELTKVEKKKPAPVSKAPSPADIKMAETKASLAAKKLTSDPMMIAAAGAIAGKAIKDGKTQAQAATLAEENTKKYTLKQKTQAAEQEVLLKKLKATRAAEEAAEVTNIAMKAYKGSEIFVSRGGDSYKYITIFGGKWLYTKGDIFRSYDSNNNDYYIDIIKGNINDRDGKTIPLPSGITATSCAIFKGKIYFSSNDGKIYYTKTDYPSVKPDSWIIMNTPTNVKKISINWPGTNALSYLDKSDDIYASSNAWENPNPTWTKIVTGAIDFFMDQTTTIYSIDNNGVLSTQAPPNYSNTIINCPFKAKSIGGNNTGQIGVISTDGKFYLTSDKITWTNSGLGNLDTNVDPSSRITTTQVSINYMKSYSLTNNYTLLSNKLSNPNFGKIPQPSYYNGPPSVLTKLISQGITNFYPFKILSLQDLMYMGKAFRVTRQGSQPLGFEGNVDFYLMAFLPTDAYLPVSDILVPNGTDITTIFCVLVANNSKYSRMIPDNQIKQYLYSGQSRKRYDAYWAYDNLNNIQSFGRNIMWGSSSVVTSPTKRGIDVDYQIGDFITNSDGDPNAGTGISQGLSSHFGTFKGDSSQPVMSTMPSGNKNKARTFAGINGTYLFQPPNISRMIVLDTAPVKNIAAFYKYSLSSPFNTFIGAERSFNESAFFDVIPEYLLAAMCGNGTAYSKLGISGSLEPLIPTNCSSLMNNFMLQDKNMTTYEEVTSQWCASSKALKEGPCDNNLIAFCQMGPKGSYTYDSKFNQYLPKGGIPLTSTPEQLKAMYPNSDNKMCGCFMPQTFYQAKDFYPIAKTGNKGNISIFNKTVSAGAYDIPECTGTCSTSNIKTNNWNKAPGGCRNIQICEQTAVLNNYGNLTNSPIKFEQANNCEQTNQAPPAPGGSSPEAIQKAIDEAVAKALKTPVAPRPVSGTTPPVAPRPVSGTTPPVSTTTPPVSGTTTPPVTPEGTSTIMIVGISFAVLITLIILFLVFRSKT